MARQIITKVTDDLDGSDADETVRFAFDGIQYEIDLSASNAAKLRDSLATYVANARKIGRGPVVAHRGARLNGVSPRLGRTQNKAIREWAKGAGKEVSARGRIPQEIVDQYHAAGHA